VRRYLLLLKEAMNLLKAHVSNAMFEDAIVLLCIDIERFVIDRSAGLGCTERR